MYYLKWKSVSAQAIIGTKYFQGNVDLLTGSHIFLGGVYSREAFTRGRRLLKYTEKITILYINVNDFVVFYPKNGIICD